MNCGLKHFDSGFNIPARNHVVFLSVLSTAQSFWQLLVVSSGLNLHSVAFLPGWGYEHHPHRHRNILRQKGDRVEWLVSDLSAYYSPSCSHLGDRHIQNSVKHILHGKHNLYSCSWLKSRHGDRGNRAPRSCRQTFCSHILHCSFVRVYPSSQASHCVPCGYCKLLFWSSFSTSCVMRERRQSVFLKLSIHSNSADDI